MNNDNTINPSDGAFILQPLVMAPAKTACKITEKKWTSIRTFSITSIVLGILLFCLQISSVVINGRDGEFYHIWCGCFYVAAGILGVAAFKERTIALSVGTLTMAALSIGVSIVASTISGFTIIHHHEFETFYHCMHMTCIIRIATGILSILAFFSSIKLVLVSGSLCSGMNKAIQGAGRDMENLLENVAAPIDHNHQPVYLQLQPIYVAARQQQRTNVKLTDAGKQTQYPQQVLYPQLHEPQFLQPTPNLQIAPQLMPQAPMIYPHQPQWPQQGQVTHQQNPKQSQFSQLE